MKTTITSKSGCVNLGHLFIIAFMTLQISAQQVATVLTEGWQNSAWTNLERTLNTYNGSGKLTTAINQVWDPTASLWINSMQLNYTYNTNGTLNQLVAQTWNQ